jgi:hypothetical protein
MFNIKQKQAFLFEALRKCSPISSKLFDRLLERCENKKNAAL